MFEMNSIIGPEIRKLRKDRGISQVELAEKTGLPRTHITNIESNKINPGLKTMYTILIGLGYGASKANDTAVEWTIRNVLTEAKKPKQIIEKLSKM